MLNHSYCNAPLNTAATTTACRTQYSCKTPQPMSLATCNRRKSCTRSPSSSCMKYIIPATDTLDFFFKSSGGWVKIKLKLPHFHVSDTCGVSIEPTLLDPEILSAASSILRPLKFCTLVRIIDAGTVLSCVYFRTFYFELLDPDFFNKVTRSTYLVKMCIRRPL